MDSYILLATTICNMGGAQKYLQSKMIWLKANDWKVMVLYYQDGKKILSGFDTEQTHLVKELQYPNYYYNKSRQRRIVNSLFELVKNDVSKVNRVVIESTTIALASWGEPLAQMFKAKHLVFTLQERDIINNRSFADFVVFKFNRKEIAGVTKLAVQRIMSSCGYEIPLEQSYTLDACSSSPVENYEYPLADEIKNIHADYIIGSIGRLDKPYVTPTIESIIHYIRKDSTHRYVLLLIGDASKESGRRKAIEQMCQGISNLTLYITGYLSPIPTELIQICNVFLSSSGSAGVSYREGVPTISIDGKDLQPIGVVGYTTQNRLFRSTEPIRPVEEYLDEVLKQGMYPVKEPIPYPEPDYQSHLIFLENECINQDYYDVSKLCWNKEQRLQRWLMPIIGPRLYHTCISNIKTRFLKH